MRFLVSVHDVMPGAMNAVETLWGLCRERGITPALLVVPSWHGGHALEDAPEAVRWLRGCADAGAEIFLHGERHDEAGLPRGLMDSARALGRTAREGEFLTLTAGEAHRRIERGVRRLRALGLEPVGFVPPAWLSREDTHRAVAALGLRYSEDDRRIRVHHRKATVAAPVIRWSARTWWRARASVVVADLALRQRHALLRLALHPADLQSAAVRCSLVRALDRCRAGGWPIPYAAV